MVRLSEARQQTEKATQYPTRMRLSDARRVSSYEIPEEKNIDPDKGFVENVGIGIQKGVSGAPQIAGKILMSYGDYVRSGAEKQAKQGVIFGIEPFVDLRPMAQRVFDAGDKIVKNNEEFLRRKFPEQKDFTFSDKFAQGIGQGATSLAFAIGTGLLLGPTAPAVAFGVGSGVSGQVEARKRGKEFDESVRIGAALGFAEGGLEFWGINKLLKLKGGAIKTLVSNAINGMATEFTQEFSQSLSEAAIKSVTGLREVRGLEDSLDIFKEALFEGAVGAVLGGSAGITLSLTRKNEIQESLEGMGIPKEIAEFNADQLMKDAIEDTLTATETLTPQEIAETQTVEEIPEFASTQEAIAFGKSVAEDETEVESLKRAREAQEAIVEELQAIEEPTSEDIQRSINEAVKGQLLREAIEASEGKTKLFINLEEKLQKIETEFKRKETKAKKEVKAVQEEAIKTLEGSNLSANDKAKFIKTVKNIQTVQQFEKALPDIIERIGKLEVAESVRTLKSSIKQELKATKVKKQAGKPVGKFTADIQAVLDQMISISKLNQTEAQERLTSNLEAIGESIPTFQQALENRLLSAVGGIENKSPQELARLLSDIKTLKASGLAASFLKDLQIKESQEATIEIALDVIVGDKPLSPERFPGFRERALKHLKTSYIGLVGWRDKLDILSEDDRASKQDKSALNELLSVSDEVTAEKRGVREATDKVVELSKDSFNFANEKDMFRKFNEDSKPINLGSFINGFGETIEQFKFTRSELRKMWMELQDPSLTETFTTAEVNIEGKKIGMGYTDGMINAINSQLTQEDIDFAKAQLQFYREFYQSVNEVYREIYGVDLPFNEFYSPISRKFTQGTVSDEFLKEINFRRSVATGSLKSRQQNMRPIKEMSDIDVLLKHITEMEHFKNWATKIRDLNAVFGNGAVREAIDQKFGKRMLKSIDNHIQDFTRGGINRANNVQIIEQLRRNFTRSVLAIKPSLTVKQMVSFVAYSETIPSAEFAAGVADFIAHPVKSTEVLMESELFKDRRRNITRDIKDVSQSESYALLRKKNTFLNSLMLNVRFGDQGAILLGGWSIYKYNKDVLKKSHKESIREFEQVTANTQQSPDIDQLSDWQRGGSFQKLFTMFTSSQNQYFRREASAIRNIIKGRITPKEFFKKIAIYHFMLPMLFQWVVDFGRWNEKNQMRAAITGSLNGLFWINDIIENIANELLDMKIFPSQTPIQTVEKGILDAIKEIKDEDYAEAIVDLMKGTVGPVTGLPVKTGLNILEGFSDIEQGEITEGTLKLMGWSPFVIEQNL